MENNNENALMNTTDQNEGTAPTLNTYDKKKVERVVPEGYVEKKNITPKLIITVIATIILIVAIILFVIKTTKNKACTDIEKYIKSTVGSYLEENNMLPTLSGEYIVVALDELYEIQYLDEAKLNLKENQCTGVVKVTNYKNEMIYTLDVTNCDYCTTDVKYSNWSKEVSNFPKSKSIVDVIPYYNYYVGEEFDTSWSKYISSDKVSSKLSEYDVYLPLDEKVIPAIPKTGELVTIEQDTKTFYSYRDVKYKYYKNNKADYSSYFASEKPDKYAEKDEATKRQKDATAWSADYPEVKTYRKIEKKTGYRWYYTENNEKFYWNDGEYLVEQPNEKYNQKDTKTSIPMYRYIDSEWRWYNGEKRQYSGFVTTPASGYSFRDDDLVQYGNWSSWAEVSKIEEKNKKYREERTDTHSRYRVKYNIFSHLKFTDHVSKNEFESNINMTVPELLETENVRIDIKFKFKYRN